MNDWFDAERHIERAHEHYEAGRWDEAETELREALALNPDRAEWHFNLGLTLEAAGKHDQAMRAFVDAHRLEPTDAQIPLAIGVNRLRLKRYADAIDWLERAQKADPARSESYVHRIEAYTALGDHEQAETMFYIARQFESDEALAYANLAESLIEREQYEKAIWCLRESARIDPALPRVHARLGAAYAATGRQERARQLYLAELRDNPGCIDTLLDLGCLLVEMNRLGEAGEKFRRVLEIESDNADAHFYLGDLAQRLGQETEAVAAYRVVLRLEPEYPGVRRRLASLSLRLDGPSEARKHIRAELRELQRDPSQFEPDDLAELGSLMLDAQLAKDAVRVFASLVEKEPDDASAHHLHAVACFLADERAAGLESTRTVLRLEPKHLAAMHNMALAHLEMGQMSRSRYWVRHALTIDSEDAALRRLRTVLRVRAAGDACARLWRWIERAARRVTARRRGS